MSASKTAKSLGLESLKEVSQMVDRSTSTLNDWYRNDRDLFNAVIVGCASIKRTPVINKILEGVE